jgi:hypothetical protein
MVIGYASFAFSLFVFEEAETIDNGWDNDKEAII